MNQSDQHIRMKHQKPQQTSECCGRFGVQRMLIVSLAVFTGFVLLVLGIVQVGLMEPFYRAIRDRSMASAAYQIEVSLREEASLEETVYRVAEEQNVCVLLFRVDGTEAALMASAEVSNDCIIHHTTGDYISELYALALKNGGNYRTTVQAHADRGQSSVVGGEEEQLAQTLESALMVRITHDEAGVPYVILLDAELTPVNATVSTLKLQFWWIAALCFLGILVLAYVLSRVISRPIVRMNESARLLAAGQYDAHFEEDGYREAIELAQTLNYAAEQLSRVDGLQKELIANISHDLRTPLTMIKGYSEVMRDIPGENTPENVQVIIDEAEHLSALVNDLLDLSRVQAGARQPVMEVFDLTEMVQQTLDRYHKLTQHDGLCITFDNTTGERTQVCADRGMILQVVYNLINNAINYCGEDRTVVVRQRYIGHRVRLEVEDHGDGIAPEQLGEIWDRYYKIDRVHRRAMVGTGLGLSIVKGILDLHGFDFGVESTVGKGSTFWFELPILPNDGQQHCIMGERVEL